VKYWSCIFGVLFLAHDAFVITNRSVIATMFVCLSLYLSVWNVRVLWSNSSL